MQIGVRCPGRRRAADIVVRLARAGRALARRATGQPAIAGPGGFGARVATGGRVP
jgi:hypothetical protein